MIFFQFTKGRKYTDNLVNKFLTPLVDKNNQKNCFLSNKAGI